MQTIDLSSTAIRTLNQRLHDLPKDTNERVWEVINPMGAHAVAVGLTVPIEVRIHGHVGYYCAGMNKEATVIVDGHCGWGIGENIMSGFVRVKGNASQAAAASGHGGMVVIEGDAGARCGIAMKGVDIVVGGSVGHMSAFMAQAGNLVVCGDAGEALGDSLYEARLFVRGSVKSLGADCIEKEMTPDHVKALAGLLEKAGIKADAKSFRRYGSARKLYNFHVDHADSY
ncbi:MAG: protein GlxC [Alphaproteobacteria bacterium]